MAEWRIKNKKADFDALAKDAGISPMLARILVNRDIDKPDEMKKYLHGDMSMLNDPHLLKDMDKAVAILSEYIDAGKKILIIGDYDADGICSSYILKKGLSELSCDASVRLPDRITDGYGMNMSMVDEAVRDGVDLILTCDNGIAASVETDHAKEHGIKVVITDHHEVPFDEDEEGIKTYKVPAADAVVDPKQQDCPYPFNDICGGVVAYKLIQCLFEKYSLPEDAVLKYLPYAAFATIEDIMPLRDENRIIVKYGIEAIKKTIDPGLNALLNVTGIDRAKLSPYHIGFIAGPCINATGRIDTADRALSLFLSDNIGQASVTAAELRDLNESRKEMQAFHTELAMKKIEEDPSYQKDTVLVLFLPDCHESLAGLIAGKLRERYEKPAFVMTKAEDCIKGSGRSIEAYDMYSEMNRCKEVFIKFGGHKGAAGFSLKEEMIPVFRQRINELSPLKAEDLKSIYRAEMQLHVKGMTLPFAKELELLEPCGMENEKPLFVEKDLRIISKYPLGNSGKGVKLKVAPKDNADDPSMKREALIFGKTDEILKELEGKDEIKLLFNLSVNAYMGRESLQLTVKDYKV
ncbi:MAG: single-stranded-DNA-specific exonuclease RecJ [Lachnospiraceae bacterium]|nr:single-stranded-DNA-specific exonuclease RecJ [Lachnospiraceae bacterium]